MKTKTIYYESIEIGLESLSYGSKDFIAEISPTPVEFFVPAAKELHWDSNSDVLNDVIFCGMDKCTFVYSSDNENLVKKEVSIEPCKQETIFANFNKAFLNNIDSRNTIVIPSLYVLPSKVEEQLSIRSSFLFLQLFKATNIYRILGRIKKEVFDLLKDYFLFPVSKGTKVHMSEVIYWYGNVGLLEAYIEKLCLSILDIGDYYSKNILSFTNAVLKLVDSFPTDYMPFALATYFKDSWIERFMFSFLSTVYLNRTIYLESSISDQKINDCIFCLFNDPQYDKIFQLLDSKDSFEYLRSEYSDFDHKANTFEITSQDDRLEKLVVIMGNLRLMPDKGPISPFFDFRELIPV